MVNRLSALLLSLTFVGFAEGQIKDVSVSKNGNADKEEEEKLSQGDFNPLEKPNTYRSEDNPYYWQNKKPKPGYWQQDVHYEIDANLDDEAHTIGGSLKLTYWNNSPDTLDKVYFHLYQNAFQPGSYYHKLKKANNKQPVFGFYERQGLGTVVKNMTINGKEVETQLDNTILIADLPNTLKPNDSAEIKLEFTTFFGNGSMRRRMKMYEHHGVKHFNGVLWYPRIAVYDHKMGWQTDQHMGKEFYGEYGTFDVSLTMPKEYIVQGTGNLTNQEEALPDQLYELISLERYRDDLPEEDIVESEKRLRNYYQLEDSLKTWKFHAENVHDFAFTADPNYRMSIFEQDGIRCIALVQKHKAASWTEVPQFMARVVNVYQQKFGPYPYSKVVVADARDGMEYPMVTLCGGKPPDNYGLIAHEVGHMWFHTSIGTNEAYRAGMDEGFTQMLTSVAMDEILEDYPTTGYNGNWYSKIFEDSISYRKSEVYNGYISKAIKNEDARLNVHSHKYNSALGHGGGYEQVYYKMGTMLHNLEYVLGRDLFQEAMINYFKDWRIAHPYPEDFKQSIMDYTGVDLNWFFNQWLNTKKTIDYKIKRVKKRDKEGAYTIIFERKGEMEMPLDFKVKTKGGGEHRYIIPNTYYAKSNADATVLPKWTGWGEKFNTTYKAKIQVDGKINDVVIDPSDRLADVDQTNNQLKESVDLRFDSKIDEVPNTDQYELSWRPELWYNEIHGLKGGLHLNGNYLDYKHQFHFTAWYNSQVLQQFNENQSLADNDPSRLPVNANAWYKTPLTSIDHDLFVNVGGRVLDGLYRGSIGFEKAFGDQDRLNIDFSASIRPDDEDLDYLLYPNQWDPGRWNNAIDLEYHHTYDYANGNGDIELGLKTSAFGNDYDYSRINFTVKNDNQLDQLIIKTRTHFEYTLGNQIAPQSKLYLAGARPEKMMDNKFARSRGFFPNDWLGYGESTNHFHYGGGLNLRGYAGYLAPYTTDEAQFQTFSGNAGGAINVEVDFDRYLDFRLGAISQYFHFDTYLFGDAGIINYNSPDEALSLSKIRGDAGLGTALTIQQWGPLEEAKPLTVRFDMPLYLSHIPATADNNFAFRWLLGVQRSF